MLVDLGKVEALLPRSEQVDGERYEQGSRIKAVITEVRSGTKGPQVILSRRDPELIKTLFELEVPEIADGLVEIRGVAREPGYRSKIAVESHAQGVDPVGACVGPRGSRVRMVVSELRGEKIDIIPWNNEPARFIAKALSPARVREVYLDDETTRGDGDRPGRPARARDRQGGHERPPRRAADRLEGRHHRPTASSPSRRPRRPSAATARAAEADVLGPLHARSSRTASAARTRRCRARSTAASRPTRRSPARSRPRRPSAEALAERDAGGGRDRPAGDSSETDGGRPDASVEDDRRRGGSPDRGGRRPARRRATAAGGRVDLSAPTRTCVGCGRKAPQAELRPLRRPGRRRWSTTRSGGGRHAYTCRRLACFERAATRRAFARTLRQTVRRRPGARAPLHWTVNG